MYLQYIQWSSGLSVPVQYDSHITVIQKKV